MTDDNSSALPRISPEEAAYLPIEDYGLIGDLCTVALVGRNGSIDWCSFPDLDRPSLFGALLDHRKGGYFRVAPAGAAPGQQRYVGETNILETIFDSDQGRLVVTDFMPLRGPISQPEALETRAEIQRWLHCQRGRVEVEVVWAPRFDYGRARTEIAAVAGGFFATSGTERMALGGLPAGGEVVEGPHGPTGRARFSLREGERVVIVCRYGAESVTVAIEAPARDLEETAASWEKWANRIGSTAWAEPWQALMARSSLALKLLCHPSTGAIAAAATTSLPEHIGGVRNWDYRFSWIRDAGLVVQAFMAMGHTAEAQSFFEWLTREAVEKGMNEFGVQVMYGLHGETALPEAQLEHLEGYRGSRPVRIGNGAADQRQHGVFGQLLHSAYELAQQGVELDSDTQRFLCKIVDEAMRVWREPDYGIWEMQNGPKHFVFSKWMVWVALDRAIRLAEGHGLPGDVEVWKRERQAVRDEVLARGYDEEVGAFVMAYDSKELDAANLLMLEMGFLPADDPRVQGTIEQTRERLVENGLVYRYLADDGLPGEEGTFVACTFWLVNALAFSGRVEEAEALFAHAAAHANHLGLYSEEIDARSGAFLGNFPQALSHAALIDSVLCLAYARGRKAPSVLRAMATTGEDGKAAHPQ